MIGVSYKAGADMLNLSIVLSIARCLSVFILSDLPINIYFCGGTLHDGNYVPVALATIAIVREHSPM